MNYKRSLLAAVGGLILIPLAGAGLWWTTSVAQLPAPTDADLSLSPVHPDEPVDSTLNERFSLENSLERVKQIRDALSSFQSLTEKSKPVLGEQATISVGNTDWETQNLGFSNWVGSVEGTLKKQEYQIKKLEFELAQKQYEDGDITKANLDQKEANYRQATQDFQAFWNSFNVSD
ncbi:MULTISPECIES: hypothetical protein [unclassified Coleofasciculus]|uniref:hypothetical protein n=1 Tax=unclassified Coleofasciculus TaxID=2692782 RepID=UPI001881236F|nr:MULTISPECIES: hypothetical protein [unclassified Coleofasciculus]MBE9129969.1 hypothetical protein [Coleofasciculus sp. LEGE 07081]MBE9147094.1 hypothetical protein [Coleofasciculus sp. LEGE 07092]